MNQNPKPTKYYSSLQEKRISKYLGWKTTAASGARPFNPGDIISEDYMGECKTHTKPVKTIDFVKSVWEKICNEAMSSFKAPILFADNGTQDIQQTLCMLPLRIVDMSMMGVHNDEINLVKESPKKYSVSMKSWEVSMKSFDYIRIGTDIRNGLAVMSLQKFKQLIGGDFE